MRKIALASLTAVLLSGSQEVARPASDTAPERITRVPFFTMDEGFRSGVRERRFVVIATAKEWEDLWRAHRSGVSSDPAVPQVEFQQEMIVAVFSGEKGTGGYGIAIEKIERDAEGRLIVSWVESYPPPGSLLIQVLTQPYHIVRLKRLDLPVVFIPLEQRQRK